MPDIYADPLGTPLGAGTKSNPVDLNTALKSGITSGRVLARGGDYVGCFESNLTGNVTVRSEANEVARLDGNHKAELLTPIPSSGTGKVIQFANLQMPDVADIRIDNELIRFTKINMTDYKINARGWGNTVSSLHNPGAFVKPANKQLVINGSNTVFTVLEILNSFGLNLGESRNLSSTGSNAFDRNQRYTGIDVRGAGTKIINVVIHDTGQGIFLNESAVGAVVHGCLIFNNGVIAPDRGHGHGIYAQNKTGNKFIENNLIFGNMGGFGIQMYGTTNSNIKGFRFNRNTVLLNRCLCGGDSPADDIVMSGNTLFGQTLEAGYNTIVNGKVTADDNFVVSTMPFSFRFWKEVLMRNNTGIQTTLNTGANVKLEIPPGAVPYTIDGNSQYGKKLPPYLPVPPNKRLDLAGWRGLGYDAQGSFSSNPFNTLRVAYYPITDPSAFISDFCFVAIYNPGHVAEVSLDLTQTGLNTGDPFLILNALDLFSQFLAQDIFSGQTAYDVDISNLSIAQPFGVLPANENPTPTDWAVLLVVNASYFG